MKCQILYYGKNKENAVTLSFAELAQRMVKLKELLLLEVEHSTLKDWPYIFPFQSYFPLSFIHFP